MAVVFFADRLIDVRGLTRRAHKNKGSSILVESFLEKAFAVIRDEACNLPRDARAQIPVFNSLYDLSERSHSSSNRRLEVSCALLCACQLAHFIGHHERSGDEFSKAPVDDLVVGLGLGQLCAAAVACSSSLVDLVDNAVYAVQVAFRIGTTVGAVSQQGHPHEESDESWSVVIGGAVEDIQRELQSVQDRLRVPVSARAYLSTIDGSECFISGHPSRLKQLKANSDLFWNAHDQHAPLVGLWHAAHLYRENEVSRILEPLSDALDEMAPPCRTMISLATGEAIRPETARTLLTHAVGDMLRSCVQRDLINHAVVQFCEEITARETSILSLEPSWSLISSMQTIPDESIKFEDLSGWCSTLELRPQDRQKNANIAIVGMSCRFPSADDPEELWDLLEQGRDTCKQIPKDRFDVDTHYDATGKRNNASHTPYGCFVEKPGLFDPRFFNMSPREATETDPMHRLALVTAYEALEMSGFVLNSTPSTQQDRVGTFYGQTCDDWREVNAAQNIETYFIPGGVRAFAPGRISYYFGFRGPSYSVDTACSSSLAAVQIACQTLITGECDTAVTGGVNILTAPDIFAGLSKGQFLSKTGSCKTWDIAADGYCRADGVGSIILKREVDAIADKDNILGVILASGTNHSADAISITHPHAGNQAYLYESVLHTAGVDPLDVSYVEMHGTGTQAGDTNEMESVTDVFAPKNARGRNPDLALHIGAVKSNIGHGEAAAGMAALIKVLMMLQKHAIPPHVGIKTKLNPKFSDLDRRNVRIPFEKTSWQRSQGKPRLAFVNNFSAAGGNTALLLQDSPHREVITGTDPRSVLPFVVSAKSLSSLQKNIRRLASYLENASVASFSSLSYTLTARRMQHTYRVGIAASDLDTLRISLLSKLGEKNFTPILSKVPQVTFVFTGQGSFYPSLARHLFEFSTLFRSEILHLNEITMTQDFPSFLSAIEGSLEEEHNLSSIVIQLALVCVQMALVTLWSSWGVRPSAVIGHSLGEYAALFAAGVLSKDDVIHLVGHRARLLQERCTANTQRMLAVKASASEVESIINGLVYETACMNTPTDTIICGRADHMENAAQIIRQAGYKCLVMDLPYAFHSAQIDPILKDFEEIAQGAIFNKPRIPVISSLLCQVINNEGAFSPEYLSRHAREPVNFMGAIQEAAGTGVLDPKTAIVEIGAHPVCIPMINTILEIHSQGVPSLHKGEDPWKTLSKSLCSLYSAGLSIDWRQFHREYDSNHELLDLPAYSFDNKNYWIDYVNDWCLHKVEPRNSQPVGQAGSVKGDSKLSTSSVHHVVFEEFEGDSGKVVAQSDLSHPALKAAIMGHLVNGAGLCPSSIYADIALTLSNYVYKQTKSDSTSAGLNCSHMEVVKPLIVKEKNTSPQILQITITADLSKRSAQLRYASVNARGEETLVHATCIVTFEDRNLWMADWAASAYLIHGRIDTLKNRFADGKADEVSRGLAYKMFSALVQYDRKYRGMERVILDSSNFEAMSRVNFQTEEKDGQFFCSPFWIDSLAHLSGFILNGSDAVDSKNFVYISHGWKSMRIAQPLLRTNKYRSYVKMQPAPNNVMSGDVYILHGNDIIGVVGGLKFQRIPRTMLNTFLPPEPSAGSISSAESKIAGRIDIPATAVKSSSASAPISRKKRLHGQLDSHRILPTKLPPKNSRQCPDIAALALDIISRETELSLSELQDECAFADLGVDSLLSLQISGKFREVLDIDVPGSVFVDCGTVRELKVHLRQYGSVSPTPTMTPSTPSSEEDEGIDNHYTSDSSVPSAPEIQVAKFHGAGSEVASTMDKDNATIKLFCDTIAEQMGIELKEVVESDNLLSLGMDSLMTIVILGILREQTSLDLPSDLFVEHPSIESIRRFLGLIQPNASKSRTAPHPSTRRSDIRSPTTYQAVSILMQGKSKTATTILFLFPDGSGSATSYAQIPPMDPQIAVYGLNCPYMTTPSAFTNGIPGVASMYLAEVRRRQPHGPYYLGGWSAGGVIAYEITQQLLSAGEQVEGLILFDSPCPIRLEPLPSRLHHFFAEIGLLGGEGQEPPSWLLPHFEASITALTEYEPGPIKDKALAPKTLAVWARHGVCRYPQDPRPKVQEDDPKSMRWLLENRTDFGFNGWDALLGKDVMEMTSIDGNHFTLMKEAKQLQKLSKLVRNFLLGIDE